MKRVVRCIMENILSWLANRFFPHYFESYSYGNQSAFDVLKGTITLENVILKEDTLEKLKVPIRIKEGIIDRMQLKIPLPRLHSEKWTITLNKLHLVTGPVKKEAKDNSSPKDDPGLELQNIEISITESYFQYEDEISLPGCTFETRVFIEKISAVKIDGNWTVRDQSELKLVCLKLMKKVPEISRETQVSLNPIEDDVSSDIEAEAGDSDDVDSTPITGRYSDVARSHNWYYSLSKWGRWLLIGLCFAAFALVFILMFNSYRVQRIPAHFTVLPETVEFDHSGRSANLKCLAVRSPLPHVRAVQRIPAHFTVLPETVEFDHSGRSANLKCLAVRSPLPHVRAGLQPTGNSVGAAARFTAETFSVGRGDLDIVVINPNGVQESCEVFNEDRNLTYSCRYTPTMEGQYTIKIKFAGQDISKSPFVVGVEDMAGDPLKVTASGPGLEKTGVIVKQKTHLDVNTKSPEHNYIIRTCCAMRRLRDLWPRHSEKKSDKEIPSKDEERRRYKGVGRGKQDRAEDANDDASQRTEKAGDDSVTEANTIKELNQQEVETG